MGRHEDVSEFYAESLATKGGNLSLSNACGLGSTMSPELMKAMEFLPQEVQDSSFGCAIPVPLGIEGKTVVDLGSGGGRDSYLAAVQVGPKGHVVGIDMTDEMLSFAIRHVEAFAKNLGWVPNLKFLKGEIEDLVAAGVPENSVDICISNCVVCLANDKEAVLRSVNRVLRCGGEFHFSDMYCDRKLPSWAAKDKKLVSEGMGSSFYVRDFLAAARSAGFSDPRVLSVSEINSAPEVKDKLHGANFFSVTYRLFKLESLDETRENYGDLATYLGTIPDSENSYMFDWRHIMQNGIPTSVDGNVARILTSGWLAHHFKVDWGAPEFDGERRHFGPAALGLEEAFDFPPLCRQ